MAKLSPEEIEKWKAFSFAWHRTQQKLLAKREKARELLAETIQNQRFYPEASVPGEYLGLQRRMLELSLANLEAYQLEAKMWEAPTATHSPTYESRNVELQLVGLRMDLIAMEELNKLVEAALAPPPPAPEATAAPAPVAGPVPGTGRLKPGTGRLKGTGRLARPAGPRPEGWDEEVAAIATDADRRALWERYRLEVAAFRDATTQALATLGEMAPAENAATRLKQLKAIKVPVLNGLAYRVNTALKGLPHGEAQLKSVRAQLAPPPQPGGRGKPAPGKKLVTDRLFDFFKPPS